MISVLHICSYVAAIIAFLFVTLSLASGLLYIAELVEEHSRVAKAIGQRAIYTIIALHVLFCIFDSLPVHLIAFGIFCHLVYLQNFSKTWPFISLTSFKFIASCVLVILDHFAWFFHFAERAREISSIPRRPGYRTGNQWDPNRMGHNSRYAGLRELSFMDVATFFGVCVWLIPFFLFLSLSANDNVLPSLGEQTPQIKTTSASEQNSPGIGPGSFASAPPAALSARLQPLQRSSILKVALDPLLSLIPRLGSGRSRSSRSQREGIIASPSPSAPPSPGIYGGPTSAAYFGAPNPAINLPYDPSSLSPQTPFANRFGESAALRGATSSPQLRSPPAPRRSATTPPGPLQGRQFGQQVSPSRSPGPEDHNAASIPLSAGSPPSQAQTLEIGQGIVRSTSPYTPGGPGAAGLTSRRKAT